MKTSLYAIDYVLPSQIVKTTELMDAANTERFGVSNKLIERVLGIEEVRHAADGVTAVDLAVEAAEKNFENSDIKRDDIDMVIYTGIEGQFVEPSTAHLIQQRLGIKNAMSFDTPNACIGFITGLQIAHWAIKSGQIKYALICSGESSEQRVKKTIEALRGLKTKNEFKRRLGFLSTGDAGGAVIIGPSENKKGILGFNTSSYAEYSKLCYYNYNEDMTVNGVMEMHKITEALIKCHQDLYPSSLSSWGLKKKTLNA